MLVENQTHPTEFGQAAKKRAEVSEEAAEIRQALLDRTLWSVQADYNVKTQKIAGFIFRLRHLENISDALAGMAAFETRFAPPATPAEYIAGKAISETLNELVDPLLDDQADRFKEGIILRDAAGLYNCVARR